MFHKTDKMQVKSSFIFNYNVLLTGQWKGCPGLILISDIGLTSSKTKSSFTAPAPLPVINRWLLFTLHHSDTTAADHYYIMQLF